MTTKDANKYIGKTCLVRFGQLQFECTITNHRFVFGRDDVEVQPVSGIGVQWVAADSVKLKS